MESENDLVPALRCRHDRVVRIVRPVETPNGIERVADGNRQSREPGRRVADLQ
jgi:hypothetical protein